MTDRYATYKERFLICRQCSTRSTVFTIPADERPQHDAYHEAQEDRAMPEHVCTPDCDPGNCETAHREYCGITDDDARELDKSDALLIHGYEFLLLPLVAVVLGLVLGLAAAPAQASKWQGWDSWCLTHHRHHQAMCR